MTVGNDTNPLRIAIIGAGPSGFYAAESLFKSHLNVKVDVYDRLPTPYGLLRGGVAPDHQRMKSVAKAYERIAVSNPNFSFYGNVKIGKDISVDDLRNCYDALIFACGAETDKKLGIPGEDLPGSYTATEFVGWYNGHPDYQSRSFNLKCKIAYIIGQGNVSIDVTRILAKNDAELSESDITAVAQAALADSGIQEIHLVGRRGPAQSAFTELEIKEMGELEDAEPVVNPADIELNEASHLELEDEKNHKARKNMHILREFAALSPAGKKKKVVIHFFESPIELVGNGKVEAIRLVKNRLEGEPGNQKAIATDETIEMPCDMVFRSVGYRGIPIEGVPFDERRGVFPNTDGRLIKDDAPMYGMYAVGWIKRGPSGVLGSNKPCSAKTVETLISDIASLQFAPARSNEQLLEKLKNAGVDVVSFTEWQNIDALEVEAGQKVGKPREKITIVPELLAAAKTAVRS